MVDTWIILCGLAALALSTLQFFLGLSGILPFSTTVPTFQYTPVNLCISNLSTNKIQQQQRQTTKKKRLAVTLTGGISTYLMCLLHSHPAGGSM